MIEIKVNTVNSENKKSTVSIETCAKHSGKYGAFVAEMKAVFGALDKTDHGVFIDALTDYLMENAIDNFKKMYESEDEDE